MDTEYVVHIHNGLLFSYQENRNCDICRKMDHHIVLSYLKSLDFNFYIDVYVGGGCGYRT